MTNHRVWAALDEGERRDRALQILAQAPVLWVWDNVEPVAGFPVGTLSAWTMAEQDELAGFLRELASWTRCKVLLTSRRDERSWLGSLPRPVTVPAMPKLQEELAGAIDGAELVILENSSHTPFWEERDAYMAAAGGFLGQHD